MDIIVQARLPLIQRPKSHLTLKKWQASGLGHYYHHRNKANQIINVCSPCSIPQPKSDPSLGCHYLPEELEMTEDLTVLNLQIKMTGGLAAVREANSHALSILSLSKYLAIHAIHSPRWLLLVETTNHPPKWSLIFLSFLACLSFEKVTSMESYYHLIHKSGHGAREWMATKRNDQAIDALSELLRWRERFRMGWNVFYLMIISITQCLRLISGIPVASLDEAYVHPFTVIYNFASQICHAVMIKLPSLWYGYLKN